MRSLDRLHLHSTMYLLNLQQAELIRDLKCKFTFHYVSIKSRSGTESNVRAYEFTFHYVSIKSQIGTAPLHTPDIYIPLCIY